MNSQPKAHYHQVKNQQQQNPLIFEKIFTFIFHPESRTVFLFALVYKMYPNVTMMDDNQIFFSK